GGDRGHQQLATLTGGEDHLRCLAHPEQLVGRLVVGTVGGTPAVRVAGPCVGGTFGVLIGLRVGDDRRDQPDRVHTLGRLLGVHLLGEPALSVGGGGGDLGDQPVGSGDRL